MNFTRFKDRVWKIFNWAARTGMALPGPMARISFEGFAAVMWLGWVLPKVPARRAFKAWSRYCDDSSAICLFHHYVRNFTLMLYRMERIRHGHNDEIGALLHIPEKERFDAILSRGGAIFLMPHAHGSMTMAEAIGQFHPLLLFLRATQDEGRAAWQREYFEKMSCSIVDVRRADDVVASRKMLSALRRGDIILGAGDFIKPAPEMLESVEDDVVRVEAFGEPVGAMRWPARFAAKTRVPIVPVNIEQSEAGLTLHMGAEIAPGCIATTTQKWMDGLTDLIRQHPTQWVFCLDRHWCRVLENAIKGQDTLRQGARKAV